MGPSISAARLYPPRRPAALLSLTCVRAVTWYALSRRDTAVRAACCTRPSAILLLSAQCPAPNAILCPVSAGLPAPPSSSRKLCCDALNTLPGTLVGARWTTPFGSSSVPLSLTNHVPEPHYCVVLASLGLRTSSPTSTSSLEPAQRRSCSWLPISAPFLAQATILFLHYSLSHLDKLPTHLTTQVPGSRRTPRPRNVGPALPHS